MLGDSSGVQATTATASSGGGGGGGEAAAPPHQLSATVSEVGHVGSNNDNNSGEDDKRGGGDGDRSFGGNRWPREETLALLRIRSDMDVAFRDASVKGPLWDEVSRKLAELGYNRSAKKCREKFENVFKYHKRTKEGRTGKHEGKTYRFFDQLEAFETHPSPHSQPPPPLIPQPPATTAVAMPLLIPPPPPPPPQPPPAATAVNVSTVPSTATVAISSQGFVSSSGVNLAANPTTILPFTQATNPTQSQYSFPNDLLSNSTSSSTSSDVEIRRRRKRKWKDFFERLLKGVIEKQEDMQRKLLEAIEKREHDRMVRHESWRLQEMARINREREILAQERSISAAKDAAVMAFLQKLSDQQPQQQQQPVANNPPPPPEPVQSPPRQAMPVAEPARVAEAKMEGRSDNWEQPSSSRWPKVEVQALINIRTSLDSKYQENGPKGPLWEEVSAEMRKLGYSRSAKRCKEKWENINKYFKKVKESSKRRSEDSKTCPYFHQLDALYREKHSKIDQINSSVPLMVRPEQQWPPPPPPPPQPHNDSVMEDLESEDNQNHGQDDDDKMDDDDEDEASGYEIVANSNRPTSMSSTG